MAGTDRLPGGLVPYRPWTWRRAARQLRAIAPAIVVLQWWHPLLAPAYRVLLRAARRGGASAVIVCHNADPHERFPLGARLTRGVLRRADHIVALSDFVAARVRHLAPQASMLRLPIPPPPLVGAALHDRGCGRRESRIPELLFFGHVRAYKGVEDLLAATAIVLRQRAVHLRVVGSFYEPLARYQRLVAELGLQAHVTLEDRYVPDDEVAALVTSADVLTLPYRSASQSGLLPLARCLRVPVVVTDVGALAAELDGHGVVVPPRSPQALAEGICTALDDPAQATPAPAADGWDGWCAALADLRVVAALRHRTAGWAAYIPTDRREEVA